MAPLATQLLPAAATDSGAVFGDPALVACAHGTHEPAGRRVIGSLVAALGAARPGLRVEPAFVDVQPPQVSEAVRTVLSDGQGAVVVPLLLSGGYHVHVDIAQAVCHDGAAAAAALGPDDRLTALLLDRLRQVGATPADGVLLAAAGSSDRRALADIEVVRQRLAAAWGARVSVGYGAKALPAVPEAIARLRHADPRRRVVVASYLLAPGFFHDRLLASGADLVTAPLGDGGPIDPRLVQVALDRYDAVASQAGVAGRQAS